MKASRPGLESTRASDPAVVSIRSAVSMLSLSRIGTPYKGSLPRSARFVSSSAAMACASGLSSSTERSDGPRASSTSMRAAYRSSTASTVVRPESSSRCRCAMSSSCRGCSAAEPRVAQPAHSSRMTAALRTAIRDASRRSTRERLNAENVLSGSPTLCPRTVSGPHEMAVLPMVAGERPRQRWVSLRGQHSGPKIHPLLDQVAGHSTNHS
jgi:hypothetical protein